MSTLDDKTKKFYLEMGYTSAQIQKAHEQAKRMGMDILDALNVPVEPEQSTPLPVPTAIKSLQTGNEPKTYHYKSQTSFLTPWKRIKQSDYEVMFSKTNKHHLSSGKIELREENYPVGLLNVSNCCYLNSLLQCYFLMNSFKKAILTAEPLPNLEETLANQSKTKLKRIKSQYELLAKLKQFFTTMALTSKKYLDPTEVLQNLVGSVGEKIEYGEEKDLSEINILIIERLSEGLTYSKNHYHSIQNDNLLNLDIEKQGSTIIQHDKETNRGAFNSIFNPKQGTIKKLFYGTRAEYYDDPDLQKQAPIVSDFTGLILHPQSGNLSQALDEQFNFQVEINGGLYKKSTFIRDQPEYLFIYINRTDFDKEEGQMMKNQHKFTFQFTVYLDRYLEKYRKQHTESHQKIKQLLASKNKLKQQINHLQILFKKIEQCQKYAHELQGWSDKLPKQEQFEQEYDRLEEKLEKVEKELDQIESRKEQYHLMYIFVHRGDAVSGHYWGYGRNDEQWYRFDINTQTILQDQIIIDLQKSSGTPYALLYVKQSNLAKFDYKIHLDNSILNQNLSRNDFRACLDPNLVNIVVSENITLHQKILARNNHNIRDKTFNEYINRVNAVKKMAGKYQDQRDMYKVLRQIEMCNNFSMFLWSKNQMDLSKFTIFEQALYSASNSKMTAQKLMHELNLLHLIQKKFKKSLRGQIYLKFYSLLPKQIQKVEMLYQEYQLTAFQVVWGSVILNEAQMYQDQWANQLSKNKEVFEPVEAVKNRIQRILRLLRIRNNLFKCEDFKKALHTLPQPLYVTQINNQITKILMLSLMTTGFKFESLQQFTDLSDKIGAQLITLNAGNAFSVGKTGDDKGEPIAKAVTFITKFNDMMDNYNNKRQSARPSASKINEQKKAISGSGFKNNILTSSSPQKINSGARKTSITEEKLVDKTQYCLVTTISTVLVLQPKDSWKLEEFDHMKVNYEFGAKLINFLKKMGPITKVYKIILKREKPLSISELREEGLFVNQKSPENGKKEAQKPEPKQQEQSLI